MILHLVVFKLNEPFQWYDDEVIAAEAATRQHPLHISEIAGWACGRNISPRPSAMDFAVIGLFEDSQALATYLIHPDHQRGVAKWQAIATWQVVDIDIGDDSTRFAGLLAQWADAGLTLDQTLTVS